MGVLAERVAHIFLPNKCMFCGAPVSFNASRCAACEAETSRSDPALCLFCGRKAAECVCNHAFEWLAAPFYYELGPRKAVLDLKFQGNLLNARKLGRDMAACLRAAGLEGKADAVVPVPLYWKDYRKRGYNQAEELARWVSGDIGAPLLEDGLEKLRSTPKQHELPSAAARAANLRGAFRAALPKRLCGGTVLLVDDVCTTGSTLEVCAAALKAGGARLVVCLTAAKTRSHDPASLSGEV